MARPTGEVSVRAKSARDRSRADVGSRRAERRVRHRDLSRTQLLDAAEAVFADRGYHATTLKEVADLAEFSVGSIYSFFTNKEDLYVNVFLRRGSEFLPGMRAAIEGSEDPLDQLHALVDFEVQYFRDHAHFGQLYLRSARELPGLADFSEVPELSANFDAAMELHAEVFARGQRARRFRAGDPRVLARLLSGLISAYQSVDPAVTADGDDAPEGLAITALVEIIDAAFRRP
ncbi:MAG TPA: TetR/AcrR family transcriptional regulator [Acidimicrobiia bacterium]|nr:TetR/AcrR family transcriptional regulator [Acidimicrobiia bacterium]